MDAADHGETRALATYEDVLRAAARIEGVAQRTPVLTSRTANRLAGGLFSRSRPRICSGPERSSFAVPIMPLPPWGRSSVGGAW